MEHLTSYRQRLNLQNASFFRIEHEEAMIAIVYKVTLPTGLQHILKICKRPKDYYREVYFLNYFADKLPVPTIQQLMLPDTDIMGAILMEYLPGTLLKETELNGDLSHQIGAMLARIHCNSMSAYGDLIQTEELNSDPRVYFSLKWDEDVDECIDHLPKTLIEKSQKFFDDHIDYLAAVDGPCIVHRDFRPGNLIIHNRKLQGIIDWASGRAGFAEEDFQILHDGKWLVDPINKTGFLDGYASIRPIPDYSSKMSLLRLSKALAIIGFTVKSGTWQTTNARVYQSNRKFLDAFF